MDKIPIRIQKLITRYLEELGKNNIPIQRAILFGSYVNGSNHEWSDIDIALISDKFEGIRFKDRNKIRSITLAISSDLSPLPYRPEDFSPDDPFVREILEHGIMVH